MWCSGPLESCGEEIQLYLAVTQAKLGDKEDDAGSARVAQLVSAHPNRPRL